MYSVQNRGSLQQHLFNLGWGHRENKRLSLENIMFPRLRRSLAFHSGQDELLRKITFFHICKNTILFLREKRVFFLISSKCLTVAR